MDTLRNAVESFRNLEIFEVHNELMDNGKNINEVVRINETVNLEEFEVKIGKYLKRNYITVSSINVGNPVELAKRTIFADYTFLSKLWKNKCRLPEFYFLLKILISLYF